MQLTRYAVAAAFCALTLSSASTVMARARFGTMCQKHYQNNWQATLDEAYTRCGWFNDELDDTDDKIFYYDLTGGAYGLENWSDEAVLETVNLAYINTHGGVTASAAAWAVWAQNQLFWSTNMRLGDEGYGLSILSTYACKTLQTDNMWGRWQPAMAGGLRIVTGSHDTVWDGVTTNEVGEDYADNLQASQSVKNAWKDGNSDWSVDQDIAVMASGTGSTNCASRRDGIKWQNFNSGYPRLMDGSIAYLCWTTWNNL